MKHTLLLCLLLQCSLTFAQKPTSATQFTGFFKADSACIKGKINGFDYNQKDLNGLLYLSNEITREDYPIVIDIDNNGQFESKFQLYYPTEAYMLLNERFPVYFYIEPGEKLDIEVDRNNPMDTKFVSASAEICQMKMIIRNMFRIPYQEFSNMQKTIAPDQFKQEQLIREKEWNQQADSVIAANHFTEKTNHLLKKSVELRNANYYFDFLMSRSYYASQDTANKVLTIQEDSTYYDFLKNMDLNDLSLLSDNDGSTFVNRFEYMNPIMNRSANNRITQKYTKNNLLNY